jgi:hypothetical protein
MGKGTQNVAPLRNGAAARQRARRSRSLANLGYIYCRERCERAQDEHEQSSLCARSPGSRSFSFAVVKMFEMKSVEDARRAYAERAVM